MKTLLTLALSVLPCLVICQNEDSTIVRQVDSLLKTAIELTNDRNTQAAMPVFESALSLAQINFGKEHLRTANCLYQTARCHYIAGDYHAAEPLVLDVKSIWGKTLPEDHPDQAKCRNLLAAIYHDWSRYEDAVQLYLEARSIWRKSLGPTHEHYLGVLVNLGILYVDIGRYEAAEALLIEAKTTFETVLENLNHRYYLSCVNNLGRVYLNLGNYESAEALYLQVIAHREETSDKKNPTYSAALNNLAVLYYEIGQYAKAETYYLNSLTAKKQENRVDETFIAGTHINLGIMQLAMKKYPEAGVNLLEGKRMFETVIGDTEHPYYASCLDYLGDLSFARGRIEEARQYYLSSSTEREKILGKEHPDHAFHLERLAILYHEIGEYKTAESYYVQALSLADNYIGANSQVSANIRHNLSELYWDMGRFDAAQQMLLASDSAYRNLLTRATRHLSVRELASFHQLFSANLDYSYSLAQTINNTKPDLSIHIYDHILFYKGFLMLASQRLRRQPAAYGSAWEQLEVLTSCHRRLANEYALPVGERRDVEALENRTDDLEKELSRTRSGFGEAIRQVGWQEVQRALKPGEAAIEFVHYRLQHPKTTDSVMYAALILRPGDINPRWVTLFEEKQLKALINKQPNQLYGSTALYDIIWKPLEKWLNGAQRLYYSPSGLLHFLALEAVVPSEKGVSLHRLASTRALTEGQSALANADGVAVVYGGIRFDMDSLAMAQANQSLEYETTLPTSVGRAAHNSPGSGGVPWPPLPFTDIEARNVATLLTEAGMQVAVRQGFAATEESVIALCKKSSVPKVLHFSTHGFSFPDPEPVEKARRRVADSKEPVFKRSEHPMMRSGLILAGANRVWTGGKPIQGLEDGIMTAYEISQLNLEGTELVVLSACETGLGKIEGNEGIYGLQRAFKIAGAKYLLMSLWQVPDFQAEAFMNAFYREWLQGNKSIPDAFKNAQLQLKTRYPEPFYWAAFILLE